ncbi:MAG: NAD+ synthase [Bacteroidetes bacterium]|nr:NAD+ synthase [Bacteroidota bacterium]
MLSLSLHYPEITAGLVMFIRKSVREPGFSKVVLGLSGGIDSALVAALAVKALGPENVLGVRMPYQTSSPDSLADAQLVADTFGFQLETVSITEACEGLFSLSGETNQNRRGNVMARMRMIVLFDRSQRDSRLVLGTSNKTELMLGYGTWYGDMASAVNPVGDLYKTQIRELSEFLGVPQPVIKKKPSADLWTGQTDEQEMGFSYDDADQILYRMVDLRLQDDEIAQAGYPLPLVRKIRGMMIRSQYKRRLPLIPKLTTRSVGTDFLYPRDWYQAF